MKTHLLSSHPAKVSLVVLFASAAFHGMGCAQMFIGEKIGVNFQGTAAATGSGVLGVLATDASAGVPAQAQVDWNNINYSPPAAVGGGTGNLLVTTSSLWYDNGNTGPGLGTHGTSGVSLSVQAAASFKSSPTTPTSNDKILLNGFIKADAVNPPPTFSFAGLAAGNYQVIVYTMMNQAGGKYSLSLGGTTYYQTAQRGTSFNGAFVLGNNLVASGTLPTANYVQFNSSTVLEGTMNLGFQYLGTTGAADGAGIAGIQLKLLELFNIWSGSTDGTWDVNTTTNWNGNGPSKFQTGETVYFRDVDNTSPAPVAVTNRAITVAAGGVAPAKITVDNSAGDYTFSGGAIGGSASVTKTGSSALILNNTNTYSGGTVVNGGSVTLGVTNALATGGSLTLATGTTLDLNGQSQTLPVVWSGAGTVTNTAAATTGTLTMGSGTLKTDFGELTAGAKLNDGAGAVALAKNTGGTLTLKGPNTFSGGTTVSAGVLSIGDNAALGTGGVTLAAGTTLSFDVGNTGLYEGVVGGNANGGTANPNTYIRSTTRLANSTLAQQTFPTGVPDNSTVVYTGYINNTGAATPWTFAENFDDYALLKINGVTILNNAQSNDPTLATVNMRAGLNSFELRIGNGAGGVGPSNQGWFTGGLGVGVDTQGRNAATASHYVALPIDSGNGSSFVTGFASGLSGGVALTGNATINVGHNIDGNGSASLPSLALGSNALRLSGTAASVAISSSTTTVGSGSFDIDANVTFKPGAIDDGGVARAVTKIGAGMLSLDTNAAAAANTTLTGTAGGITLSGSVGSQPLGGGTVVLNGSLLTLGGQIVGSGLLGQYYASTPASVNNSNPNFATLSAMTTRLDGLTPTVTALTTLNGKADFNFSNDPDGRNGAPFNGGDSSRGDYGFANTDNMEVRWTGYINITQTGVAHFETTSDDGTVVFIDGNDTPVVNNNFFQGFGTTRSGDYNFTTTGYHKITLGFYEGGGGAGALFRWNQAGGTLHTLLNTEVTTLSATQSYNTNVVVAVNSTIAVSNSLQATVGTLSIGANTLTVSSADTSNAAYSLTAGVTTLTGNATFAVSSSAGGGAGTIKLGPVGETGGARNLTKTGNGTLILTGDSTYTGTTVVSAGVLRVGEGGTAGSLGTGAVTDDAAIIFNRSDSLTVTAAIDGTGTVTNAGGAGNVLNLDGAQGYAVLNANAGTTNVNGSFTDGQATVNANATVNFGASQKLAALNIGTVPLAGFSGAPASLSVVPEPGTLGLLTMGALGVLARRRRKSA